ncbi:hypothetical protein [Janibacter melonis]|uniref:hypothetical protein n=1 Tax=Janibacter melonis TaxID=262209 RepID=UPI0020943E80|nr:hypothetical protein [Janibacter melonis]
MMSAPLPENARRRIAGQLRANVNLPLPFGKSHTIPISRNNAEWYFSRANLAIDRLSDALGEASAEPASFPELSDWVKQLVGIHDEIRHFLSALSPFQAFEHPNAMECRRSVADALTHVCARIESGELLQHMEVPELTHLTIGQTTEQHNLIAKTFGIDPTIRTEGKFGVFQAGAIFKEYLYNDQGLRAALKPHFSSLRVPQASDGYACILLLGAIVTAEDYVLAASASKVLLQRLDESGDSPLTSEVVAHLVGQAPAMRQNRVRVTRLLMSDEGAHEESRNMLLADLYKRVVEGSFKHYLWALWCLGRGSWSEVPMLSTMRAQISASAVWESELASTCIIPQMRNAEAHESIAWDGHEGAYRIQGELVSLETVRLALSMARSFSSGCEGAFVLFWSLLHEHGKAPPGSEPHALDGWERAVATFGANGVDVLDADVNRPDARLYTSELEVVQINPSFVALINAQISLPKVVEFTLVDEASGQEIYTVSASALLRARWLRSLALQAFASMPFSVFLPANWDARRRREAPLQAIRSVSWISVDDTLDATITASDDWTSESAALLVSRINLASAAAKIVLDMAEAQDCTRLRALVGTLDELQAELDAPHYAPDWLDSLSSTKRLRHYYNAWGPVPRLPGFPIVDGPPDAVGPAQRTYWY